MPKELPGWFADLDKDKDGQVGLYEWKKADKDMKEFTAMDLNGDGFITAEETLRYLKIPVKAVASATSPTPSTSSPSTSSSLSSPPSSSSTSTSTSQAQED